MRMPVTAFFVSNDAENVRDSGSLAARSPVRRGQPTGLPRPKTDRK
jgi:hypothetical protein